MDLPGHHGRMASIHRMLVNIRVQGECEMETGRILHIVLFCRLLQETGVSSGSCPPRARLLDEA